MAPRSDLRLLYIARYLMKNLTYILHNLLDLCRCSKSHLKSTHPHLLSQKPSTRPVSTKKKNPMYILPSLLDPCRCLEIHLNTTHTRLLHRQASTRPVATKMVLQLLQDTAAVQAGTSMSAATAGSRKLAMRAFRPNLTFWARSTIVPGTVAALKQLHL